MAKLVQIAESAWVNLDLVIHIQFLPDHPRQVYSLETKQREPCKADRLVFSFAAADSDGDPAWVEATDEWARSLRNSLKVGSLNKAVVISRGVQ